MTQEHPEQPKTELVEELRELVDRWDAMSNVQANGIAYQECANELRELINE